MNSSAEDPHAPERLAELRAEIDRIDQDLLSLIARRLATGRAVGACKKQDDDGHLWLDPRREQAVIDALLSRAGPLPPSLVEAVWRELIGFSLQAQIETRLVVVADAPERIEIALRRRFGSAAPLVRAASAEEALRAACVGQAVAILACDAPEAIGPLPDRLVVFELIRDEKGAVIAAAIGRIAPERVAGPRAPGSGT